MSTTDTNMEDLQSLNLIRQGGKMRDQGVTALYRKYAAHFRKFFLYQGLNAADAEDVVQNTFIKIDSNCESYRGDLLEATVVYGIRFPHLTPKLLPQPEHDNMSLQPTYERAGRLFHRAPAVIILGYSFGQRSDGFDDAHSFEFFVSLLKLQPRPVFVVSPTPHDLAEILRDRLSCHNVFGIPLRWELFSGAVLANADPVQGLDVRCLGRNSELVMRT